MEKVIVKKVVSNKDNTPITASDGYEGYVDNLNIIIVVPKIEELKVLIEFYFECNKKPLSSLKLDYFPKGECVCLYSSKFLYILTSIFKHGESLKIKMKKDYPIWLEDDNLIVILAPRVEEISNQIIEHNKSDHNV